MRRQRQAVRVLACLRFAAQPSYRDPGQGAGDFEVAIGRESCHTATAELDSGLSGATVFRATDVRRCQMQDGSSRRWQHIFEPTNFYATKG